LSSHNTRIRELESLGICEAEKGEGEVKTEAAENARREKDGKSKTLSC